MVSDALLKEKDSVPWGAVGPLVALELAAVVTVVFGGVRLVPPENTGRDGVRTGAWVGIRVVVGGKVGLAVVALLVARLSVVKNAALVVCKVPAISGLGVVLRRVNLLSGLAELNRKSNGVVPVSWRLVPPNFLFGSPALLGVFRGVSCSVIVFSSESGRGKPEKKTPFFSTELRC